MRLRTVWAEVQRQQYPTKLTPEVGPAPGSIKVIYVAGYSPVPEDLQFAVAFLVSGMKRNVPLGGSLESERIGDYSYKLRFPQRGELEELGSARQLLSVYKEVAFG